MGTPTAPRHARADMTDLAATTPAELAGEIRAAIDRVYACAQAWRASPSWQGDKLQRKAYECVVVTVAEVAALADVQVYRDVDRLVDVLAPILGAWWPPSPGPQEALQKAVDDLRRVAMHRVIWVRQARSMLGQPW